MFEEQDFIPYEVSDIPPGPWLIVAPHPDDEVFGLGGSIALAARHNIKVEVIIITQGDKAGDPEMRRKESLCAGKILGISKYHFWTIPDRKVNQTRILPKDLKAVIDPLNPKTVFLPGIQEFHPDHRATTQIIWPLLKSCGFAGSVWLYEISRQNEANRLVDISSALELKREAINCFSSQLLQNDYETVILAINSSRAYTLPAQVTHAEAFWACDFSDKNDPLVDQYKASYRYRINSAAPGSALVSVIVRTHNRTKPLIDAIHSISSQSYVNLEIVLVNDGGKDISRQVLAAAMDIPVVMINHERCLGRAVAANSGLKSAKGKYITFLDDDDLLYPDHIDNLVGHLEKQSVSVVYSSVINVHFTGSPEDPGERIKEEIVFDKPFDPDLILFENYIPIMSVLFAREVVDQIGFFDEELDLFEDWDFWIRVSRNFIFEHLNKITAEYRFYNAHEMEESHQLKYFYDRAQMRIFEKVIPYLNGKAWKSYLRNGAVGRLHRDNEKVHQISIELEKQLKALNDAHEKCFAWGQGLNDAYEDLKLVYSNCEKQNIELNTNLIRLNAAHDRCAAWGHELHCQIEAIYNSRSWKITAPIRWAYRVLRKGPQILFHRVYHLLPLSYTTKYYLKSFFYNRFTFLFRHSISYKIWINNQKDSQNLSLPEYSEQQYLVAPDEIIDIPECSSPLISIVMTVFSDIHQVLKCLKSIQKNCSDVCCEVFLLLKNVSDSRFHELEKRVKGAVIVKGAQNQSDKDSMIGADRIRGDFVLLLSSHALVLADTISELRETFEDNPDCGLVGAKIISQTNKVLEAGCRVKNDGTINRLGAGMDPRHPDISFLRQVDFLSAICLMMPKDLFLTFNFEHIMSADSEKLGEQFAQAARKSGLHVFFQPLSQVFLSGSKNNPNPKTFSKNHISNDKNLTREEKAKGQTFGLKTTDFSGNILVLDIWTPTPDQDSGSMDMYSYFKIFISLGYQVTFIPAADLKFIEKYTPDLQRIGVRCLYKPFVNDIAEYLRDNGKKFDLVMVYRVHCAAGNIAMIQRYCPDAKIIFDTVDLHYLREERRAKLESSDELLEQARITKNLELSIIQKSDATILLSPVEKELLLQEPGIDINKIFVIPLIRDIPGRSKGFGERKGILFIGGFQHAPNVDAMVFFLSNIWPLVKGSIPDLEFSIVGSKVPETIRKVCNSDVKLLGYVKDIEPLFSNCRVSVAPLRYGAGLKGKIATSLSYGVPCVATSIAVEGSGMKNKKEIYVADKPEAFAQAVVELHENEEIWNVISQQGLEYVQKHYSIETGRKKIGHLLKSIRM